MLISSLHILLFISSILFQDNFNDGNADDWFTVGPSSYSVEGNRYHFSGGGAVNDATSYRGENGEVMSTADYCARTDVDIDVGTLGGLMVRYSEEGLYNMMLVLNNSSQSLNLYRWYWNSIELIDSHPLPVQTGATYRVKFQCFENTFSGKSWRIEEPEPEEWFVSTTDTLARNGAVALFSAGTSKTVYLSCFFDNVVVEEPYPYALSQSTWAAIKAAL